MPAGYSSRCRVCNSPHRQDIEQWLTEGASPRTVSARLEAEHGEKISHQSIWKHRDEHFNVREEAAIQYQVSRGRIEQAAALRVNEIELLDQVIARAARLNEAAGKWLDDLVEARAKLPKAVVDLFSATASEVRQAATAKAKLLGEDGTDSLADALLALAGDDDASDS